MQIALRNQLSAKESAGIHPETLATMGIGISGWILAIQFLSL